MTAANKVKLLKKKKGSGEACRPSWLQGRTLTEEYRARPLTTLKKQISVVMIIRDSGVTSVHESLNFQGKSQNMMERRAVSWRICGQRHFTWPVSQ